MTFSSSTWPTYMRESVRRWIYNTCVPLLLFYSPTNTVQNPLHCHTIHFDTIILSWGQLFCSLFVVTRDLCDQPSCYNYLLPTRHHTGIWGRKDFDAAPETVDDHQTSHDGCTLDVPRICLPVTPYANLFSDRTWQYTCERRATLTKFQPENFNGGANFVDLNVDCRTSLK